MYYLTYCVHRGFIKMLQYLNSNIFGNIVFALLLVLWVVVLLRARVSGWLTALLSFVGTIGHEISHAAVGWVLGARPVSFSIVPKRVGDRWVLGSVGFANLNLWNSGPVSFAPLLLLVVGFLVHHNLTLPSLESGHYAVWFLSGYFLAVCVTGSIPSFVDVKIGALSAVMYVGIACFILWWWWIYFLPMPR